MSTADDVRSLARKLLNDETRLSSSERSLLANVCDAIAKAMEHTDTTISVRGGGHATIVVGMAEEAPPISKQFTDAFSPADDENLGSKKITIGRIKSIGRFSGTART